MGQLIDFEGRAVAQLRDRLGQATAANADLAAFARGHRGVAGSIHCAVLRAIAADSFEDLLVAVSRDWPADLRVDKVALALLVGGQGFLVRDGTLSMVDGALVEKWSLSVPAPTLKSVAHGHPGFVGDAASIRCQALLPIEGADPLPRGLLLIGQYDDADVKDGPGRELLEFLAASLAAIMRRWLIRD